MHGHACMGMHECTRTRVLRPVHGILLSAADGCGVTKGGRVLRRRDALPALGF